MDLRVGTSGYSYAGWKGSFYPEKTRPAGMLEAYARRLPAVEINSTFYRLPKRAVIESWAASVPDSFRFSVKASRRITHFKRLENAADETAFLLGNLEILGDRLGVILFQTHPALRKDVARLESFLDLLPAGTPAAFEFRHPSWHDADALELLRRRNLALCQSDRRALDTELLRTSDWGYLRLRQEVYGDEDLDRWLARIAATGWKTAYVFFKHETSGPELAGRLLARAAG